MGVLTLLTTDEFKKTLIEELNRSIDLPLFNEDTEAKIFEALIEALIVVVVKIKNKFLSPV